MSRIISPNPWKWGIKPPFGTPIDWSNPITNGLESVFCLNEYGGNATFDLINGKLCLFSGSITWEANAINFSSAGNKIETGKIYDFTNGHSQFAIASFLTGSTTAEPLLNDKTTTNWTTDIGFDFHKVSSGGLFLKIGSYEQVTGTNIVNLGYPVSLACSWNPGVWQRVYANGVLKTSTGTVSPAYNKSSNTAKIGTYYDNASSRSFNNLLYYLLIWRRPLASSEFLSLHLDPYQIFQPPLPYYLVPQAPAGGNIPEIMRYYRQMRIN